MAVLIPESLRNRKGTPDTVKQVASALTTALEDNVTVWYEPACDETGERPDFVVLDPNYGVLVIEVLKGTGKSTVLGGINGELRISVDGKEQAVPSPLNRAEAFADLLRASIAAQPQLAHVPVGALMVFTGLTRETAEAKRIGDVIDLGRCLFKTELAAASNDASTAPLLRVFGRAVGGPLKQAATDDELTLLRAIIHPETIIHPRPTQGALFSAAAIDGDELKVMDRQQERLAKSIGGGHRVIRGVAGSGKTLVLVARARMLSRMLPSRKILVTCYTRSLASQLRKQLADCPNVDVRNLDKLMGEAIRDAGMKHPGYGKNAGSVAKEALLALDTKDAPKFRAVLVDEAQDFDADDLQFCIRLLEATDPDEQDLIIVADSAQNIFKKNFTWKDAGVRAQGRTRLMRTNYRNTKQILAFAYEFLTADLNIAVQTKLDPDDEIGIIPAEASKRSGAAPRVIAAGGHADELAKVVEAVKLYYGDRSRARSVAVLYGEQWGPKPFAPALAAALGAAGLPYFWVTDPNHDANKDRAGETDSPIVLSTIRSAKGLEFPAAIVCGLGQQSDLLTARKIAYVGMTRAINDLTVVVGKDSPFRADLVKPTN